MLERSPEMRAFYEQAGSGATMEERVKAMQDWQRGTHPAYGKSFFVSSAIRWPRRSHCCLTRSSGLPTESGP